MLIFKTMGIITMAFDIIEKGEMKQYGISD